MFNIENPLLKAENIIRNQHFILVLVVYILCNNTEDDFAVNRHLAAIALGMIHYIFFNFDLFQAYTSGSEPKSCIYYFLHFPFWIGIDI